MTNKPSLTTIATLCMIASLTACGGGGGSRVGWAECNEAQQFKDTEGRTRR